MFSNKLNQHYKLRTGSLLFVLVLILAGCSKSDSATKASVSEKGTFYLDSTNLENRIARGCEYYWFGTGYFKLFVEKEASDNEILYMANQFEKAGKEFQEAIYIDESAGGFQYKRYINYRDLAQIIAATPNGGLKWSWEAEGAHEELLKWCNNFALQMQEKYTKAPDLNDEGWAKEDVLRIP